MRYLSVCSGIEAASVAWHHMGWVPAAFSEIEPFPRALLAHRFPGVPCHGDFTTIGEDEYGPVDLVVGGTPCQDFSVAGLRAGLDGERGNLTLEFARLAYRKRARLILWENVPGVFSANGGRDFGAVLACFAGYPAGSVFEPPEDGWRNSGIVVQADAGSYGLAWRVLDAQFAGVPQRRRRVFVVGHLGDWRRAAAVLFEREGLYWNPPPRREPGQRPAPTVEARAGGGGGGWGTDFLAGGGLAEGRRWPADVASTLNAAFGDKQGLEDQHALHGAELFVPDRADALRTRRPGEGGMAGDDTQVVAVSPALNTKSGGNHAPDTVAYVVGALTAKGPAAMGAPEVDAGHYVEAPRVAFDRAVHTTGFQGDRVVAEGDVHPALSAGGGNNGGGPGALLLAPPKPIVVTQDSCPVVSEDSAPALKVGTGLDMGQPPIISFTANDNGQDLGNDVSPTVRKSAVPGIAFEPRVASGRRSGTMGDVVGPLTKESDRGDGFPCVAVAHVDVMPTMRAASDGAAHGARSGDSKDELVVPVVMESRFARNGRGAPSEVVPPLKAQSGKTGKGDAAPLVVNMQGGKGQAGVTEDQSPTLGAASESHAVLQRERGQPVSEVSGALHTAIHGGSGDGNDERIVQYTSGVRRLTPRECERLQGFPDDWTLIPTKTKRKLDADELARLRAMSHEQLAEMLGVDPETFTGVTEDELLKLSADGPRYKALGNSMAVPVMRWIGERIQLLEDLLPPGRAP